MILTEEEIYPKREKTMTLQKILLGTDKRVIPRQLLQSLLETLSLVSWLKMLVIFHRTYS